MRLPSLADISLSQAVAMVTINPACAAGLPDRGEIAIGKRADLVAVKMLGSLPQAEKVWVGGELVLSASFDHV
jgi:alpha-D-ribose 1-methylphosphonate 5-triphosphate diphosphatase